MRLWGTKEIKDHVQRLLSAKESRLRGARALDFPAGNGVTSSLLSDLGANVTALDLFPELFRAPSLAASYGDLSARFPIDSESIDFAICQEGIEHVGNQDHVLREFSRVLRARGRLILTTPNHSSLKSKLSYLFCESEAVGRIMPVNEHDSIWFSPSQQPEEGTRVYFGHCFLVGFFKLRLFALLAGLRLIRIHDSRVNTTSLIAFPLIYPFIVLNAWRTARRFKRKGGPRGLAAELLKWMISPKLLLENHLILEFEKQSEPASHAALSRASEASFRSFTT